MYVIYKDFSMLTGQTGLPPNQPTGLKVENVHYFGIFQPIWLKLGTETQNERTQCMYVIYKDFSTLTGQTGLPPNQPTGSKVENVHNLSIFQSIWVKLGMESLNGRTQCMHVVNKDFSTLTGQTGLPAYKRKMRITLAIFNQFDRNLVWRLKMEGLNIQR